MRFPIHYLSGHGITLLPVFRVGQNNVADE